MSSAVRGQPAGMVLGLLALCYPILIYTGLQHFPPWTMGVGLVGVIAARLAMSPRRTPFVIAGWLSAVALVAMLIALPTDGIRLYPVIVSLSLAAVFIASLISPPSAIERIARIGEPDLPPAGVIYTRHVTIVWVGFFLLNAAIATWTALFASLETWTLYNGFISYIAMGVLFGAEFLVRQRMLRSR